MQDIDTHVRREIRKDGFISHYVRTNKEKYLTYICRILDEFYVFAVFSKIQLYEIMDVPASVQMSCFIRTLHKSVGYPIVNIREISYLDTYLLCIYQRFYILRKKQMYGGG